MNAAGDMLRIATTVTNAEGKRAVGTYVPAVQADGSANPVVKAVHAGTDIIQPQKPKTLAKSIAIGNPADGYYVIQAVKESGGWAESVTDDEIVEGIKTLAETEGVWTEPAGGTTMAVTKKLLDQGRIPRNESIVIAITGNGLKTQEAVLDRLEEPSLINAKLSEFDGLIDEHKKAKAAPREAVAV